MMLDAPTQTKLLSLDELMKISKRVEIIDGNVVEKCAAGMLHQFISQNIYHALDIHVRQNDFAVVFSTGVTYLMLSDAKGLKDAFVPDISFIRLVNILPMADNSK